MFVVNGVGCMDCPIVTGCFPVRVRTDHCFVTISTVVLVLRLYFKGSLHAVYIQFTTTCDVVI